MVKFIIKRIALGSFDACCEFLTFLLTYLTDENPAVTILHAQGVPHVTPQQLLLKQSEIWLRSAIAYSV